MVQRRQRLWFYQPPEWRRRFRALLSYPGGRLQEPAGRADSAIQCHQRPEGLASRKRSGVVKPCNFGKRRFLRRSPFSWLYELPSRDAVLSGDQAAVWTGSIAVVPRETIEHGLMARGIQLENGAAPRSTADTRTCVVTAITCSSIEVPRAIHDQAAVWTDIAVRLVETVEHGFTAVSIQLEKPPAVPVRSPRSGGPLTLPPRKAAWET